MKTAIVCVMFTCLLAAGCRETAEEITLAGVFPFADNTPEAQGVFDFLNDGGTTFELLDIDVDLDRRAAENIVAHRNGPDGIFGTPDDDPFGSVDELDGVAYVGPSAIEKIYQFAQDNGWISISADILGTFDGVQFTFSEAEAVLSLVNTADLEILDVDVALDARAANAIIANRPVTSIAVLAELSYVGQSALEKLKYYAKANGYPLEVNHDPVQTTVTALQTEAAENGTASTLFEQQVTVSRAVVTSVPSVSGTGNTWFTIADPQAGSVEQLKVYIASSGGFELSSLSIHDEVTLTGTFTAYNSEFEILLDATEGHHYDLLKNGLSYNYYQTILSAWATTRDNPEGAVFMEASFGYNYMIPLPLFMDHPAFDG
ncbi:helix-hairpin-helix domain-containing protein, partial [Myxococcota bacterium]|nr:helix-hairpin-helix domain-containing protein [Myxococcota bacterium]